VKSIILVAGKGTRMAKHYEGPKHLLPINGKPVLGHVIDSLPQAIDGIIAVVGGPHEQRIRKYFKEEYQGDLPVEFVVQREQLGLPHAFRTAEHLVKGRWLGMVGDDLFDPEALEELTKHDLAILASRVDTPENFGVLVTDDDNNLEYAVEKPKEFVSDLVWNGAQVMDEDFFKAEVEPSARGEYETPDVWTKMIKDLGRTIKVVEGKFWLPINDKEQLEKAEKLLAKK